MQVRRLDATGKLQGQRLVVAEAGEQHNIINSTATPNLSINTLSITGSRQGITFLINTGDDASVLPATAHDKRSSQLSTKLTAANGTPIKFYGKMRHRVTLDKHHYTHDFYIAEVTQPILGANFFLRHHLAIDVRSHKLLNLSYGNLHNAQSSHTKASVHGLSERQPSAYDDILQEFPSLLVPNFPSAGKKHGVEHFLDTIGPPLSVRARRLDPQRLAASKAPLKDMEDQGIIRKSKSP